MPEFVRYDLQHVVGALGRFRPGSDVAGHRATYLLHNQSLVLERYVEANAALLLQVVQRQERTVRIQLPFTARLVTIQNHARIFGLNGNESITAKVALAKPVPGESFFREVRARGIVGRFIRDTAISVPPILQANPAHGWIIEGFVTGSAARVDDMAVFLAQAHSFYRPTVRLRPIAQSAHNRLISAQLRQMLERIAPRLAVVDDDAIWLNALGHGDLGLDNLLVRTDGRLWVLDWEKAKFLPLAVEMGRLYLRHPTLKQPILNLIESLMIQKNVMPPVAQLAFGAAYVLRLRPFGRETRIRRAVKLGGKSLAAAAADHDLATMAARKAIANLADAR